jgi:hypothetical protein
MRSYAKEHWWAIRGVAVNALARCVTAEDAPWVLDLYFQAKGPLKKHELLPVVSSLPVASAGKRLERELRSADTDNRQAAMKAVVRMPFPNKLQLLEQLADDPNPDIRGAVRSWLSRFSD